MIRRFSNVSTFYVVVVALLSSSGIAYFASTAVAQGSSSNKKCTEDVAQTVTGSCTDCGMTRGRPRCPGSIITVRAVSTCKTTTTSDECAEGSRPASYYQTCNQQPAAAGNANCVDVSFYFVCVPGNPVNSTNTSTFCQ